MGKLDRKIALVTGGYPGIGGASTELFAQEGAIVVFLIEELLGPGSVLITKLITDYGKITGSDDMLELIYFFDAKNVEDKFIYDQSVVHICFSVENIKYVVEQLKKSSGKQCTDIHEISNGNKCCFCKDPEGNWLELIEQAR